ncbi:hypothetical protein JKF63_01250 [Porcisia hertigi]|uniref:Uncharacterized protein n=1 Tax=Porcisia hertigi TaxID=2761500 RepID=A0A836I8Y5_9TRYP|nr:hypothetical protein JKF63_01250 [Porcisia hertigi]
MLRPTDSVTLHFAHAAVVIGLIVSSILSPIQVRTIKERQMYVYGVALVYHLPPNAPLVSSGSVPSSHHMISDLSGGPSPSVEMTRVTTSLSELSSSTLKSFMTAYLVFAVVCLLLCVSLILSAFVQMLPTKRCCGVVAVTRMITLLLPLAAILCFSMAAVLGLKSSLYRDVAAGYYSDVSQKSPVGKLHSGFSSTVAAVVIEILVFFLLPLLKER